MVQVQQGEPEKKHLLSTDKRCFFSTKCALRQDKHTFSAGSDASHREVPAGVGGALNFAAPKEQLHYASGITSLGAAKLHLSYRASDISLKITGSYGTILTKEGAFMSGNEKKPEILLVLTGGTICSSVNKEGHRYSNAEEVKIVEAFRNSSSPFRDAVGFQKKIPQVVPPLHGHILA